MKTKTIITLATTITASAVFSGGLLAQTNNQTPAQRIEKGVFLQQTKKDIDAAIVEFLSVLEDEKKAKSFGAEARFRLMQCYLSQDDEGSAEKQLKALKKNYPANNRWVKKAIRTMHKPIQLVAAPWQSGEFLTYDVKLPNGKTIGQFLTAIEQKSLNGKQVWVSYLMRQAGIATFSKSVFDSTTYQPISAHGETESVGEQIFTFPETGGAIITDNPSGKEIWKISPKEATAENTPLYDNDQMIQVMRTVPHQIGTEYQTKLITLFNNSTFPFGIKVTAHEEITTDAGKFQCAKLETSINQTVWVSTDANRYIVRMNIGQTDIDLARISQWDPSQSETVKAPQLHASATIPGGWIYSVKVNNKDVCRIALADTGFTVKRGLLTINLRKNLVPGAQKSAQAFADEIVKNMKTQIPDLMVDEHSKDTGNVGEVPYLAFDTLGTQGKLKIHTYHVYAVGKKGALALRLYHNGNNLEKVKAKVAELIQGITIE